jgi:hypothetical protein
MGSSRSKQTHRVWSGKRFGCIGQAGVKVGYTGSGEVGRANRPGVRVGSVKWAGRVRGVVGGPEAPR